MSEVKKEIGQDGYAFVKANATIDDKDVASISEKQYREFMSERGVTEDLLKQKSRLDKELFTGAYMYNTDRVEEGIVAAKKSGSDPKEVQKTFAIATTEGVSKINNFAERTTRVPQKSDYTGPDVFVTRHNPFGVRCKMKKLVQKSVAQDCESRIQDLLK